MLVNEDFGAGASHIQDKPYLSGIIQAVTSTDDDPRSLYLRGLEADMAGAPDRALALFQEAASGLETERSGLFDARRRGTVIENRVEIVRDLALRLLALGRPREAFAAFESMRARGMGELAAALAQSDIEPADRQWLAELVQCEAGVSKLHREIVRSTIATGSLDLASEKRGQVEALEQRRSDLLEQSEHRAKFTETPPNQIDLGGLAQAVRESGIPVVMYWCTAVNVLVWVVTPEEQRIRAVFLPEGAVEEKVARVVELGSTAHEQIEHAESERRELYLFLIAPFADLLAAPQVVIIPQGALVGLPFEMLIDAEDGSCVVQRWAVSYAPSATLAARALRQAQVPLPEIRATFDKELEADTGEIEGIAASRNVDSRETANFTLEDMVSQLTRGGVVHVLLHGEHHYIEPLLSHLLMRTNDDGSSVSAAELLAADLRDAWLVVLSSCESGRVRRRISNELLGLPWTLSVNGAQNIVVSRWRVQGESNAAWMRDFYGGLGSGGSVAMAAAEATRAMLANGGQHPHLWAPMQVIGR